jgi:hypothetical protein
MKYIVVATVLPSLVALAGCTPRPFVRTDGPVTSDGVAVALVGQRCGREPWDKYADVLTLDVRVQVTNASAEALALAPEQVKLLARGNSAVPNQTAPDVVDGPRTVAAGASAPLRLKFRRVGNARCNQEMQLALDHAFALDGRAVGFRPIAFVPERSDR